MGCVPILSKGLFFFLRLCEYILHEGLINNFALGDQLPVLYEINHILAGDFLCVESVES